MADTFLVDQWVTTHAALGITPDLGVLDELVSAWSGEGRFYHASAHLKHGLLTLNEYGDDVALVRLAWFFHDAIYVSGRGDNEQRSADWFASYARHQGLDPSLVERGERLILMTKDHQSAVSEDPLWPIMNDVDLGIFAAPRDIYDAYATNVWREYEPIVTRQQFVLGRAAFMAVFRSSPIFRTDSMKGREQAARANIDAEIARLTSEARDAGWL